MVGYFASGRLEEYCDQHVCLSVCLFDMSKFHEIFCGCSSVPVSEQFNMLCISSLANDVMCHVVGPVGQNQA